MAQNQKKRKNGSAPSKNKKEKKETKQESRSILYTFRREICGAICAILAILVFLCAFEKTRLMARLLMGFIGDVGLYVLPIGLALCAIALLFHNKRPVKMRVICSISFVLLVAAITHLWRDESVVKWSFSMGKELYLEGQAGVSGGVFGGFIAMLFSLLGGRAVALALCIILLLIVFPASLNLTITAVLRAINDHREELQATKRKQEEERREPAEKLVEHVVRQRQQRALRRGERERFEYDLPVDDPTAECPQPPEKAPETVKPAVSPKPAEAARQTVPYEPERRTFAFDIPVDGPLTEEDRKRATLPPEPVEPTAEAFRRPAKKPAKPVEKTEPDKPVTEKSEQPEELPIKKETPSDRYSFPSLNLLRAGDGGAVDASAEMRENTRRLQDKLACFNVDAQIVNVIRGPSVTMFELELAQGIRLNRLTALSDDIALELGASGVRISAIPDRNSMVGVEVPNKVVTPVPLREVIDSPEFRNSPSKTTFAVGKDLNGNCIVGDISKMPHILIAGTTGSGKSVCMNSLIISLLYKATPEEVKLIMIDPKMVELGIYNEIPHLMTPVVTDPRKAAGALQWAVSEMLRRYSTMSEYKLRDIESYNRHYASTGAAAPLPKIIVVIDELADLMLVAGKEVEESICRIAQMGRAAGVHLVIATQRPSADVITGTMKSNIPSRIAFAVSSVTDSRIILDVGGAEKLVGKGDMLYAPQGKNKLRVQGCLITDEEVQEVIDHIKSQGEAEYSEEIRKQIELKAAQSGKGGTALSDEDTVIESGDELLPAAVEVFLETKQASVSMLQRRLKLGYARAARIVDEMEDRGIVGPYEGSKARQLLVTREQWNAMQNGVQQSFLPPRDAVFEDEEYEETPEEDE